MIENILSIIITPIGLLTITVVLLILYFTFGHIKIGEFELGIKCDRCKNSAQVLKMKIADTDIMRQRQYNKMDIAIENIRKLWLMPIFSDVVIKTLDINKDVTATVEFSQFRNLVLLFEVEFRKMIKKILKDNGLVKIQLGGYIADYMNERGTFLFYQSLDWFDQYYKNQNILTISWTAVKALLTKHRDIFTDYINKMLVECFIIALEHEIFKTGLDTKGMIPTAIETQQQFIEKYGISQADFYNKFYIRS